MADFENQNQRTNNALVQTFGVNNLNQLTNATRSGTLTVAGLASERKSLYAGDYGLTNVVVSGTGLTTGNAELYADGSWAKANATLANGNNTYTATAKDYYNRTATDSVTVNLPATNTFSYDGNGNLTGDGFRVFEYDFENQLTNVYVASAWRSEFKFDGFGRRKVRKEYTWQSSAWVLTNELNLYTPTKAAMVPPFLTLAQVRLPKPPQLVFPSIVVRFANRGLGHEPFAKEGKLAYSNSTPKRLARLVALSRSTQGRGFASFFTSARPVRHRLWMRPPQLCRRFDTPGSSSLEGWNSRNPDKGQEKDCAQDSRSDLPLDISSPVRYRS